MKYLTFILISSFMASASWGSFKGIESDLNQERLAGHTRPCCNFALDVLQSPEVLDPSTLGTHSYRRKNKKQEAFGMAYTCNGGFIDVAHDCVRKVSIS
jgi:hypothetical protein